MTEEREPMKMHIDKDWCERMAAAEGDSEVGAGFEAALEPERLRALVSMTQPGENGMGRPALLDNPEHCPGSYVMYFYCKYKNPQHPWQSGGGPYMEAADQVETRAAAIRQMRQDGWLYHRDNTATCPLCATAIRKPHP